MYAKDSFDRFGDDLVRLLLSYHTLDDRNNTLRKRCLHECVSKQFQRLIFDTITDISIDDNVIDKMRYKDTDQLWLCLWPPTLSDKELSHKLVTFVQKKCPNVQRFALGKRYLPIESRYLRPVFEAMDQLRDNWPHLKSVVATYRSDNAFVEYLVHTFGPMITQLEYLTVNQLPYATHCHHLDQLVVRDFERMFTAEEGNHLLAINRLKEMSLLWTRNPFNAQRFQILIDYYKTSLRRLNVQYIDPSIGSQPMVTQFVTQLSGLQELRELTLHFTGNTLQFSLYDSLKTIGIKCAKLKKFSLKVESNDTALNVKIINAIKYMRQLKRLHLWFSAVPPNEVITAWTQLQAVNGWPQLTHLAIELWDFRHQWLEQIVSTQHKLQTLYIIGNNHDIDTKWLDCISRLPSLESLSLSNESFDFKFKKSDLKAVLNKCPKMRSIKVFGSKFDGKDFDDFKNPFCTFVSDDSDRQSSRYSSCAIL